MKTTGGKTKAPKQGTRPIRIWAEHSGKVLACKEASSLKEALKMYYEDTLRGYGYTEPKHTGNTLTVTAPSGDTKIYVALEVYQEHVLRD